jgi:DNA-binding FadR family transcriptional regulator
MAILSGAIAPGEALPSERALSEAWGINRHAIREAIGRLQQARLVAVAQGGATRVLDWRRTGGLELLITLGMSNLDPEMIRSVLELRACIGEDAARLCAQRAPARLRRDAALLAEAVVGERDALARAGIYERLWEHVVDGSGNVAYRLALNSLVGGLELTPEAAAFLAPTDREARHVLAFALALRDRDGDGAARAAGTLLRRPVKVMGRFRRRPA